MYPSPYGFSTPGGWDGGHDISEALASAAHGTFNQPFSAVGPYIGDLNLELELDDDFSLDYGSFAPTSLWPGDEVRFFLHRTNNLADQKL